MSDKPVIWIGSSRQDLREFPPAARRKAGFELQAVQRGESPSDFKPIPSVGPGNYEIRIRIGDAFRVFYVTRFEEGMYSTRSKKRPKKHPNVISKSGDNVTKRRKNHIARRVKSAEEKSIVRGSGNVFRDLGFSSPEAANLKIRADLMLDLRRFIQEQKWSQAEAAAFFAETQPRISNLFKGEISRFSVDKLINMLTRAGIKVRVQTNLQAA